MCARAMMCVREYYAFIIIVIDGKVDANQKKKPLRNESTIAEICKRNVYTHSIQLKSINQMASIESCGAVSCLQTNKKK